MSLYDPCLIRSRGPSGEPVVRLGLPLVDDYLEFLEGRCRPNTVLAAAYDLRVFFGVVAKPPADVASADVLGFITAQRTGRSEGAVVQPVVADEENVEVATSTVARRFARSSNDIIRARHEAKRSSGWVMDNYLLRRKAGRGHGGSTGT